MVNFPIGFVGFHPVTQVTLYHLDLSYNNLGSTSCQAVLVFFLVLWKEAGVFWVFHYDSNKNSHFIFMDRCLCVCWYTERLYICTYLQVCIIKDPSHQKVIWQSRKACNLFLFSLGEFLKVGGVFQTVGGIWWILRQFCIWNSQRNGFHRRSCFWKDHV